MSHLFYMAPSITKQPLLHHNFQTHCLSVICQCTKTCSLIHNDLLLNPHNAVIRFTSITNYEQNANNDFTQLYDKVLRFIRFLLRFISYTRKSGAMSCNNFNFTQFSLPQSAAFLKRVSLIAKNKHKNKSLNIAAIIQ